jgi:hypothetical protein
MQQIAKQFLYFCLSRPILFFTLRQNVFITECLKYLKRNASWFRNECGRKWNHILQNMSMNFSVGFMSEATRKIEIKRLNPKLIT